MATKKATVTKTTTKKVADDQWKKDLRKAYDVEQKNQIKASNKSFDQAKVNADTQATSRGMGRSSYLTQTMANLDKSKSEAQNTIRDNISAAYLQAVQQQQNVIDQLTFQQEQAAQAQANWEAQFNFEKEKWNAQQAAAAAAASGGGGGGGSSYSGNTGSTGSSGSSNWASLLFGNNGNGGSQNSGGIVGGINGALSTVANAWNQATAAQDKTNLKDRIQFHQAPNIAGTFK